MVFAIHWHESAMDLHVFPILIPPPACSFLFKTMARYRKKDTLQFIEYHLCARHVTSFKSLNSPLRWMIVTITYWRLLGSKKGTNLYKITQLVSSGAWIWLWDLLLLVSSGARIWLWDLLLLPIKKLAKVPLIACFFYHPPPNNHVNRIKGTN